MFPNPGGFPLFFGKVPIVSRTLSGLFLVGALKRPRKRKGTNRENPRTIPEQIGKIPEKSGKSQKGQKRTKKEGQVQIGKPPRLKHPRLAALDPLPFQVQKQLSPSCKASFQTKLASLNICQSNTCTVYTPVGRYCEIDSEKRSCAPLK